MLARTMVHIAAGFSGLVASLVIGQRRGFGREAFAAHNMLLSVMGASLLWIGWLSFNSGPAYSAGPAAAQAALNSHLGAATGSMSWMSTEWVLNRRPSVFGIISGALAGLIAVTPGAGYMDHTGAFVASFVSGALCYWTCQLKHVLAFDDALDAFGISDNGQDAAFWEGVQTDVPVDRLLKGGWTLHSALLYNHPTKADDLDPGQGEWLCIGAREVGKDVLLVAAMAKRQDVLKRTSTSSEVHQSNGVYWYCCPGKSFGFSRHPRVDLRSADTEDQDGDYRLSWHLGTDTGGWRAGMRKNLVRERGGRFEKLIFYLRPSKIWSAEPFDRLFIGRCVIVADKSKVMSQGNDYQPVPLCWSGDEIESIHASSSNSSLTCLKDGSTQNFYLF